MDLVRPLDVRTPEQLTSASYRAHALALLLVFAMFLLKSVAGLTTEHAPFTLYALVVAVAALGGIAPAVAATLFAILLVDLSGVALTSASCALFALESLAVASILTILVGRISEADHRNAVARDDIEELRTRARLGSVTTRALQHLDETAANRGVIALTHAGSVILSTAGAGRLLGSLEGGTPHRDGASSILRGISDLTTLLREAAESGVVRRTDTLTRQDGSTCCADVEVRPFNEPGQRGYTITLHDLTSMLERHASREAALRVHVALRQSAAAAEHRLVALECLTDPALNPAFGVSTIHALLESLRTTLGADGVALVEIGLRGPQIVAAVGVRPEGGAGSVVDVNRLTTGRATLVHNDGVQVAQTSAVRWPKAVTSLMAVPVMGLDGARSIVEVVNKRSQFATDWEVALVRIVADRLSAVAASSGETAVRASAS
jgi:hypothetical protein